ncbi:hypothetical protein [Palleronia marisminoris]|nr:hypothetical protein [Palleronia marisminoris]
MLMADGITASTSQLTALQSEVHRHDAEIADVLASVRSQQEDPGALRAELLHLSYHLGLGPAPTAGDA